MAAWAGVAAAEPLVVASLAAAPSTYTQYQQHSTPRQQSSLQLMMPLAVKLITCSG